MTGKEAARALYDFFFQAKMEGRFHRPSIYEQKRQRPFGKFYYVHHELLPARTRNKQQVPLIYVTYYDMGKVYDRRGKR